MSAWNEQKVSYLFPPSTGGQTFPVEVLAAGFAFPRGGVHGPLQVQSRARYSGNPSRLILLGLDLRPRHLRQQVLHGPFGPILKYGDTEQKQCRSQGIRTLMEEIRTSRLNWKNV